MYSSAFPRPQSLSRRLPGAIGISGRRPLHSPARKAASPILGSNGICPRERNVAAAIGAVRDRSGVLKRCFGESTIEVPPRRLGEIELPLPTCNGTILDPTPPAGDRGYRRLVKGVSIGRRPGFCPWFRPRGRLCRAFLAR